MVPSGHLEVSGFIKKVHEQLREQSKILGIERAWENHCTDSEKLKKYALAMKELATKYWEKSRDHSSDISRITWVYHACVDYFITNIFNIREKELEIARKINKNLEISVKSNFNKKLKILDVGSCYNPFREFNIFEVTALDIAPAANDVHKCDFLQVDLGQTLQLQNNEIQQLPGDYFDVVVFSLLLEYLPSPVQRKVACEKAYNLLKSEGLLLVITPDSNHVGSNAKYIKSWRFVISNMGFSRIKYEKLKHIHCMAFRKSINKEIPKRWADIHKNEQVFDEIFIPQDFKQIPENNEYISSAKFETEGIVKVNKELPFYDI
ncbi:unnamed protein product [Psylliodes chrysocephalus]|uniref:S-adenosylmethionine sensor upstream of mTORC1 n=1 Tax=Psylliodes chrysocephalus TaxID=3402493 RepID=A0A9P0CSW4_9CUCU|nr:unnamed protein product [Psylliodes chrysocephala]